MKSHSRKRSTPRKISLSAQRLVDTDTERAADTDKLTSIIDKGNSIVSDSLPVDRVDLNHNIDYGTHQNDSMACGNNESEKIALKNNEETEIGDRPNTEISQHQETGKETTDSDIGDCVSSRTLRDLNDNFYHQENEYIVKNETPLRVLTQCHSFSKDEYYKKKDTLSEATRVKWGTGSTGTTDERDIISPPAAAERDYGECILPPLIKLVDSDDDAAGTTHQLYEGDVDEAGNSMKTCTEIIDPHQLDVVCGGNRALFCPSRWEYGGKGACVFYEGRWLTPNEFQLLSGRRSAKDWKRSIKHHGTSLKALLASRRLQFEPPAPCRCDKCVTDRGDKVVRHRGQAHDVNIRAALQSLGRKRKSYPKKKRQHQNRMVQLMGNDAEIGSNDGENWSAAEVTSRQGGAGITHGSLKLKIVRSSPPGNQKTEAGYEIQRVDIEEQLIANAVQKRTSIRDNFNRQKHRVNNTLVKPHGTVNHVVKSHGTVNHAKFCGMSLNYGGKQMDKGRREVPTMNWKKREHCTQSWLRLQGHTADRSKHADNNGNWMTTEGNAGDFAERRDIENGDNDDENGNNLLLKTLSEKQICVNKKACIVNLEETKRVVEPWFSKSTAGEISDDQASSQLQNELPNKNIDLKVQSTDCLSNTAATISSSADKDKRLIHIIHELRNYKTQLIRNIEHTKKLSDRNRTLLTSAAEDCSAKAVAQCSAPGSGATMARRQRQCPSALSPPTQPSPSAVSKRHGAMSTVHHFPQALSRHNNALHQTDVGFLNSPVSSSNYLSSGSSTINPLSPSQLLPSAGVKRAMSAALFNGDGAFSAAKKMAKTTASGSKQLQQLLQHHHTTSLPVATVSPTTRRYVLNAAPASAGRHHHHLQQQREKAATTFDELCLQKRMKADIWHSLPQAKFCTPKASCFGVMTQFTIDESGALDLSRRGGGSHSPLSNSYPPTATINSESDVLESAPLDLSKAIPGESA